MDRMIHIFIAAAQRGEACRSFAVPRPASTTTTIARPGNDGAFRETLTSARATGERKDAEKEARRP